jgi:adenosylhomocysteine nucleosidase
MRWLLLMVLGGALLALLADSANAPAPDSVPRIAVFSAHAPELPLLLAETQVEQTYTFNGVPFITGQLRGNAVVLFFSGAGSVTTAMTAQLALDHFHITHLVSSGIADSANPTLHSGAVVVPERWGAYPADTAAPPAGGESTVWFEADAELLGVVSKITRSAGLARCGADGACLPQEPRIILGGRGLSGPAAVDPASSRAAEYETFPADALDAEAAALAQVAAASRVPYVALRSLLDQPDADSDALRVLTAENNVRVLLRFLEAWADHCTLCVVPAGAG